MKKIFYIMGIIGVVGIVALVLYVAGSKQTNQTKTDEKLNVIVSILPQKAFVEAVGGDLVNVKELIPSGGSPATYEPKPSDLVSIEKADIYFRIGYIPFEKSHVDKFLNLNPDMDVVDTSKNVELRYFGVREGVDPHIWLSPMQVKKQVDIIQETFSIKDPKNAANYQRNAEDFKKQLDDLHIELETKFKGLKTNKLMVFHPAWGYFADEYGLEQIAIEQSGKEPTAEQLQHLIDEAKEEEVKVIFIQSQFNKEIAESIAEEIDAVIVSIDPLSEDYINNLRNVATTIY